MRAKSLKGACERGVGGWPRQQPCLPAAPGTLPRPAAGRRTKALFVSGGPAESAQSRLSLCDSCRSRQGPLTRVLQAENTRSGLRPPPGVLPTQGLKPCRTSLHWQAGFTDEPLGRKVREPNCSASLSFLSSRVSTVRHEERAREHCEESWNLTRGLLQAQVPSGTTRRGALQSLQIPILTPTPLSATCQPGMPCLPLTAP